MRERALIHLTQALADQRGLRGFDEPASRGSLDVALELFVALGALSGEEADDWRRRFEAAEERPEPNARLRKRAREHLAHLDKEAGDRNGERLEAAVAAFAGLGLLTKAEEREWNDRLQTRAGDEELDEDAQRWLEDAKRAKAFDDSTVLSTLIGPHRRVAGMYVTLVELAAGGVVVHWHFAAQPGESSDADAVWRRLAWDEVPDGPEPFKSSVLGLTDDIGTDYLCAGSGYSSTGDDRHVAYGETSFVPAVPADATRLEVILEGLGLSIRLPLKRA